MSARTAVWLALSACSVSLLLMAFSLVLIVMGWSTPLPKGWTPWREQAVSLVGIIGAPILGGLIASRRPENPYGWLWLGLGLSFALVGLAEPYAAYALVAEQGSLPAPRLVNQVLGWAWGIMVTFLPFVLLLFPTGRLPSRPWRFLAWVVLVAGAAILTLGFFSPDSGQGPVKVPFAFGGIVGEAISAVVTGAVLIVFAAIILSAVSLVFRFHRAAGVERQQIKWFAYAASFLGAYVMLNFFIGGLLNSILTTTALLALCVAIGIAILRYRLYDIDVVINRTLVYASLTVTLVLLYFGGIVVLQRVFVLLTGQQSTLAVVASTLLIAALFTPLRRRTQSFIDRRFYRSKYDARKTLEAFSVKLRDETDLEALNDNLVGVVRETMQPAHVSLWLRSEKALKGAQTD
jgi:hypothetical protein